MVIIEGPDGAGKTTVAEHLCEKHGLHYMRYEGVSPTTGSDAGVWEWWDQWLNVTSDAQLERMVFDRCAYISEVPHQLVMRGRKLTATGPQMMDGISRLEMIPALIIFCLPPWEVLQANVHRQAEKLEGVADEDLEKVAWAYHSLAALWSNIANVHRYDYTIQGTDDLDRWVEEWI